MGYTRVIQSGNTIEIYNYQKQYVPPRKRDYKKNTRRASSQDEGGYAISYRRTKSVKRAKSNIIRLVQANLQRAEFPIFLTLTLERERPLELGYAYLKNFWQIIQRRTGKEVAYVGVPEWQKRGVLHFHFLVWGLGGYTQKKERSTRNLQRLWNKGFCDVRNTTHISNGLAGYMAKYLTKALIDKRLGNRRAYTCSRNIFRPTKAGSNALNDYLDEIIPVDSGVVEKSKYDTMWLGQCDYTRLEVNNKNQII